MKKTASKITVWCWLAAASFLGGCITLYKGIDKMTHYYNSEYSFTPSVNAYVGGDAYNYIINGTYIPQRRKRLKNLGIIKTVGCG